MTNQGKGVGRGRGTVQQSWSIHRGDRLERKQSEMGLRKSERLFWETFDRATVGIAHTSLEGHWLRVNQQLCDLLGYNRDELTARTFPDVTHPDDLSATLACRRRFLAGEQDADELDKRYVRKDGTAVWVHVTISLVRTRQGAPDYFIVMVQDITERKRLEQERAQLLEWERAARREAEATNAQLQALQALTDTALSHLALEDLLRELLDRVTAVMGVDHAAILLLDDDGQTLTVRASRGLTVEQLGGAQCAVGQGVPGRIAASRAPVVVDAPSAADLDGIPPMVRGQLQALAGVPLLVEDQIDGQLVSRLIGVIGVASATPRHFTQADVQLLQRAADRIALAIDRARLYAAEQEARQQAQMSEVQASERAERLHTILETMADGVAVYNAEGRPMQLVNRAYRELFAVERGPAEYESMTTVDRSHLVQVRDSITGASLPFEDTPVGRALRGEVVTGPSADIRARAFDSRELELNSSAAPLREPDGRIGGAVLVLRDMSERNRLAREREEALTHAEHQAEQLDRIFESVADGLIVYDREGRIVRENPAARRILALDAAPPGFRQLPERERFARYALRDEHGHPLPPEETPTMRARRAHVGTGSGGPAVPEPWEVRMRALDGREIDLKSAVAPLRDREGHFVGVVSVLHDLTERNRLAREREAARADELAAHEATRRMEEFLAVAAHDLRTPLTATVGFIDLAERQGKRLEVVAREESRDLTRYIAEVRSRLEHAKQSAERLRHLLALLFDTAAIRAGKLELHRAPVDLAELVREQVEALRVAAPQRTITLQLPPDSAPIPVEADADRIGQVITNFVTNALKYSPSDRPVEVTVSAREGPAGVTRVLVCDQGPGIPKEEQGRVWDLFHRVPGVSPQSETYGGSLGLGLHICKAIITAHGGRVGVKSTVGHGSTFWLTLPLAGLKSPGADVGELGTPPATPGQNRE